MHDRRVSTTLGTMVDDDDHVDRDALRDAGMCGRRWWYNGRHIYHLAPDPLTTTVMSGRRSARCSTMHHGDTVARSHRAHAVACRASSTLAQCATMPTAIQCVMRECRGGRVDATRKDGLNAIADCASGTNASGPTATSSIDASLVAHSMRRAGACGIQTGLRRDDRGLPPHIDDRSFDRSRTIHRRSTVFSRIQR
jgi:hypothetical protein